MADESTGRRHELIILYSIDTAKDMPSSLKQAINAVEEMLPKYHATVDSMCDLENLAKFLDPRQVQPQAILIMDEGLLYPDRWENSSNMLDEVIRYAREGGRVIFCDEFALHRDPGILNSFIKKRLGIPWRVCDCYETVPCKKKDVFKMYVNPFFKHWDVLTKRTGNKTYLGDFALKNVKPSEALYVESGAEKHPSVVAFRPFFNGYIGFAGAQLKWHDEAQIVFSMCGLKEVDD